MKRKKQFVSPRVIQEVRVQLENDLLVRSLERDADVIIQGIEEVETNLGDNTTYEVFYD